MNDSLISRVFTEEEKKKLSEFIAQREKYFKALDEVEMFPKHTAGLILYHNDHKTNCESAKDWIDRFGDTYDWPDDEEQQKAIAADEIWCMTWHPNTPIDSHSIAAASLEALLNFAKET